MSLKSSLEPVSIIIPIKNRCSFLPQLIQNLLKINYPKFEIVIVDDCSTDGTKELLKQYENMRRVMKTMGRRRISPQIMKRFGKIGFKP